MIVYFLNKESVAIEFTGELRKMIAQLLKVGDDVDVRFRMKTHKNKHGKVFNNNMGTAITRL